MPIRRRASSPGFTIIELLMVVGIIALLAVIAIPNMVEAQTRSKVARVKSDLRTVAAAMESYAVDNNKYPPNFQAGTYGFNPISEFLTFAALTTPVPYVAAAPMDVFRPDPLAPARERYFDYVGADTVILSPQLYPAPTVEYWKSTGTQWGVSSIGPDIQDDLLLRNSYVSAERAYDSTNGSISAGDIGRTNLGQLP